MTLFENHSKSIIKTNWKIIKNTSIPGRDVDSRIINSDQNDRKVHVRKSAKMSHFKCERSEVRVFVYKRFGKSQLLNGAHFGKSKRRENALASLVML